MIKKRPVENNDENSEKDVLTSSYSSCECTGLIPSGDSLSEEEFDEYKSIYPFSDAKIR